MYFVIISFFREETHNLLRLLEVAGKMDLVIIRHFAFSNSTRSQLPRGAKQISRPSKTSQAQNEVPSLLFDPGCLRRLGDRWPRSSGQTIHTQGYEGTPAAFFRRPIFWRLRGNSPHQFQEDGVSGENTYGGQILRRHEEVPYFYIEASLKMEYECQCESCASLINPAGRNHQNKQRMCPGNK